MGNCLVTKLKSVVDNDNLFGMNELKYRSVATVAVKNLDLRTQTANVVEVVVKGNVKICNYNGSTIMGDGKSYTLPSGTSNLTIVRDTEAEEPYYLTIKNPQTLEILLGVVGDNITPVSNYNKLENIREVLIVGINSNIIDFRYFNSSLELCDVHNSNLLKIDSIDKLVNITRIRYRNIVSFDGTYAWDDILTRMAHTYSRNSGSLIIETYEIYNNITLNGNPVYGVKTIKFGTDMVNPTAEDTARGWQVAS